IEGQVMVDLAEVAVRTFGVSRAERVLEVEFDDLEDLARKVFELNRKRVAGKTFAVRVRRSGSHEWRSSDAERSIGRMLLDFSAGVNLDDPEVTVRLYVRGERALVAKHAWEGQDGLPIGTQDRALVLLSGGIDSPVAAWMMMRRGCPIDILHFQLDCAQADHALAVGYELVDGWGYGADAQLHVIDFQATKDALHTEVRPGLRQVLLKVLMTQVAGRLANRLQIPMLVTGDSLGQVSSQTSAHLVAVDHFSDLAILRPLVALPKEEIVSRARQIGTYELSIRGKEVCDLSEGKPVATAASVGRLEGALENLDGPLLNEAEASWTTGPADDWHPGATLTAA
ncbi:MAG: tRNA sulfurtransferase, partial [Acidimicrobiia bacterium]